MQKMEENDQFLLQALRAGSYEILPQRESASELAPMSRDDESRSPPSFLIERKSLSKNRTTMSASIEEDGNSSSGPLQKQLPPKVFLRASPRKRILFHVATGLAFVLSFLIPTVTILPMIMGTLSGQTKRSSAPIQDTWCSYGFMDFEGYFKTITFSTMFEINNPFGIFSFQMAKFIDLVWDIVVSRGGQALLGWITYKVYTAALMKIMETHTVSYDLYASLTLSSPTLSTIVPVTKGFFKRLGFRRKLLMFWMILSIAFVSFWPTITNAMTGYVPLNTAMVLIQWQNESIYTDYTNVTATSNLAFQFAKGRSNGQPSSSNSSSPIFLKDGPNTTLWTEMYQAVWSIDNIQTPIQSLSFLLGPKPVGLLPNETYQKNGEYFNSEIPENMLLHTYFYFQGQYYDWYYFQSSENVICIQTEKYGWGFSSILTILFDYLLISWCIGTYGVWVHMNRKSEMCLKGRMMDKYRAVADLSEAMENELGSMTCAYSGEELSQELDKLPGVKYVVTQETEERFPHIGLSSENDGEGLKLEFGTFYGDRKDR